MITKTRFPVYTDGVLWVCDEHPDPGDFGAIRNARQQADLTRIVKLAYKQLSCRATDVSFAESIGRTLSLKVKTRLIESVTKTNVVTIGDTLYSIIHLDDDRAKREMYFYLEEVRKL